MIGAIFGLWAPSRLTTMGEAATISEPDDTSAPIRLWCAELPAEAGKAEQVLAATAASLERTHEILRAARARIDQLVQRLEAAKDIDQSTLDSRSELEPRLESLLEGTWFEGESMGTGIPADLKDRWEAAAAQFQAFASQVQHIWRILARWIPS